MGKKIKIKIDGLTLDRGKKKKRKKEKGFELAYICRERRGGIKVEAEENE